MWLQAEELAQLRRTIGALTGPAQGQPPQQPRLRQPPEWAEFYDLGSSPEGGSNGQSREQLGVFARSTPTRAWPPHLAPVEHASHSARIWRDPCISVVSQ